MNHSFGRGLIFAVLAFFLWGILPLYWKLLIAVNPLHILAFRIILSLVLVGAILLIQKNFNWLTVFKNREKGISIILAAFALSANWGLYIWAVNNQRTIEASLGYYINPLVSIILGMIFFREKLKPLQWGAFGLAVLGVVLLTIMSTALPWISLVLALTFGSYGLFKKKTTLTAMESLGAETLAVLPLGLFLLLFTFQGSNSGAGISYSFQELSYITELPIHTLLICAFCGLATMLPLYFFSKSAKILPLSTIGFIQFLGPTIQFLLGLFLFKENFTPEKFIAFGCVWFAVILYIISLRIYPKGETKNV